MLKLASWNVNSLKVRLPQVLDWIKKTNVDILALQETKILDEYFPKEPFEGLGYNVAFSGQKTYNGVALISRQPIAEVTCEIPGFEDTQRRMIAATTAGCRVLNLYVPNGSEIGSDKYQYKLSWLEKIRDYIAHQLKQYTNLAVVGDFNIAPKDIDVHDPKAWEGCIHVSPPEREAFFELLKLGLKDSFRTLNPDEQKFSWWDYRAGGFRRNNGLRIDHILLSDDMLKRCEQSGIDIEPRRAARPSDHAPVWVQLK
ncbi:exodeoxyribonuclease III [Legionella londiniensis]|uniref:Endonuclease/exonuclease/phosphatase domain-containing protein n=1 Tax=Legionella londiniensis TaxID=45068 RepID=A0A0W0VSN6_9GAMM|nr:exodeoxyribonuclease III [Legionella londiniensis]KTD23252.1 hypothetical protein Llon_0137 [Legionella londiniensis]STX93736.1 exodeoxyribonuclease III [Legionella londiniensis]